MNVMRKIIAAGMKAQSVFGALCLIAIVVLITASVFLRYVLNNPLAWTEELITFVFIWLSFVGAGVVAAKRRHVAVDFITGRFSARVRFWVQLAANLLIMALLAVMFISTVALLPSLRHVTVTLGIPRYFYNLPILFVSFYMMLVYLEDTIVLFRPDLADNAFLERQKEVRS